MEQHPLAGQAVPTSMLANIPRLVSAYYTHRVDVLRSRPAGCFRNLGSPGIVTEKQF
jgi:hypothetical protein